MKQGEGEGLSLFSDGVFFPSEVKSTGHRCAVRAGSAEAVTCAVEEILGHVAFDQA